jgi:hypothetical protein
MTLYHADHWRNEVRIGPYTLLASSYIGLHNRRRKAGSALIPTLGIYLDEGWEGVETAYPKQMVEWPDCGVIEMPLLKSVVGSMRKALAAGEIIDVACLLGHGRTGTLLARLLVDIEELPPDAAISELLRRYCSYAVEYEV